MSDPSPIVVRQGADYPATILRTIRRLGPALLRPLRPAHALLGRPGRRARPGRSTNVDSARVRHLPTPAQALAFTAGRGDLDRRSRASVGRLWAYYLLIEDPQRRLDARAVSTLAHQVSLVRHILDSEPQLTAS